MKPLMILFALLCVGCGKRMTQDEVATARTNIVKIRDCEYIESYMYYGWAYTHAGDCPNPKHKENKQ